MLDKRNQTYYRHRRNRKKELARESSDKLFFNILLLVAAIAVFYLMLPMINSIIIGILTATVFYGLNVRIMEKFGRFRVLGAATTTTAIVLLVFVPLTLFLYSAVQQGIELTNDATDYLQSEGFQSEIDKVTKHKYFILAKEKLGINGSLFATDKTDEESVNAMAEGNEAVTPETVVVKEDVIVVAEERVTESDEDKLDKDTQKTDAVKAEESSDLAQTNGTASKDLIASVKDFLTNASTKVLGLISMAGEMLFSLLITLLVMFYVFFDGERILNYIRHLSPLPHSQFDRIIDRIKSVSKSSIQGTFLTACCQGLVAIVGLMIAGIPALFLGTLIGISSVIPVVGTAVVLVPLLGYLLIVGQGGTALFILIWSLIFNNVVDYMIRPILMKGDENMPTVLLLFAIVGGVGRFGLLGFVYGPVIFGIMAVMLWIYEERNSLFLSKQDVK